MKKILTYALVSQNSASLEKGISDSNTHFPPETNAYKWDLGSREGQLISWARHKSTIQQVVALLAHIDPIASTQRVVRLEVCSLLKALAAGSAELLPHFENWACQFGNQNKPELRKMWKKSRLLTNCDHPSVSRARAFLRVLVPASLGTGPDEAWMDEFGAIDLDRIRNLNPSARALLETASSVLADRALLFTSPQIPSIRGIGVGGKPELDQEPASLCTTPISFFTFDPLKDCSNEFVESPTFGQLLSVDPSSEAYIAAGDVIGIRKAVLRGGGVGWSESYSDNIEDRVWYLVIAIDILFARIRVQQCPLPPPLCWSHHHAAGDGETFASMWLPVSLLWSVIVSRQLPLTSLPSNDTDPQTISYCLFLTPVPTDEELISLLSSLPPRISLDSSFIGEPLSLCTNNSPSHNLNRARPKANEQPTDQTSESSPNNPPPVGSPLEMMGSGKVEMAIQSIGERSAVVCWEISLEDSTLRFICQETYQDLTRVLQHKKGVLPLEVEVEVTLSVSQLSIEQKKNHHLDEIEHSQQWIEVYRGVGKACEVSGLRPLTPYQCRLTILSIRACKPISQLNPRLEHEGLLMVQLCLPTRNICKRENQDDDSTPSYFKHTLSSSHRTQSPPMDAPASSKLTTKRRNSNKSQTQIDISNNDREKMESERGYRLLKKNRILTICTLSVAPPHPPRVFRIQEGTIPGTLRVWVDLNFPEGGSETLMDPNLSDAHQFEASPLPDQTYFLLEARLCECACLKDKFKQFHHTRNESQSDNSKQTCLCAWKPVARSRSFKVCAVGSWAESALVEFRAAVVNQTGEISGYSRPGLWRPPTHSKSHP